MKKARLATKPKAVSLGKLWRAERITLSLGAYDQSRDFNDRRGVRSEPQWMGYLQQVGDADGLLPVTLYVLPWAAEAFDRIEDGCLGRGHLELHSEVEGHLHYKAVLFDPTRELTGLLETTFLHAAVCGFRWVEVSLVKKPLGEDEWLAPWETHSHSASHSIQSARVHARAKLPGAPQELFDWVMTGEP